jgi:hypothetical protein
MAKKLKTPGGSCKIVCIEGARRDAAAGGCPSGGGRVLARLPMKWGYWLGVVGKVGRAYGINISSGVIVAAAFSIER